MCQDTASTDFEEWGVIVCSDHRMLGPACCTLLSASQNFGPMKARLFLLVVDVDAQGQKDVRDFAAQYGIHIEILELAAPPLGAYDFGYWSVATIARLYMDTVVPPTISRLLYLDADTLVVAPLAPLFEADMRGRPVGAVDDCLMAFPRKMSERMSRIGMSPDGRYFNAGVLLFDWSMLQEHDFLKDARDLFLADPDRYPFNDQDVLNVVLEGNWFALSARWNTQTGLVPIVREPGIKHFTGSHKPWKASWKWMHRDARRYYRETLKMSPWSTFCSPERPSSSFGKMLSYVGASIGRVRKTALVRSYFARLLS